MAKDKTRNLMGKEPEVIVAGEEVTPPRRYESETQMVKFLEYF